MYVCQKFVDKGIKNTNSAVKGVKPKPLCLRKKNRPKLRKFNTKTKVL